MLQAEDLTLMAVSDFPTGLKSLPKLKKLQIEHFIGWQLLRMEDAFPSSLETLSLSWSMSLCPLPKSVCKLPNLKVLELDNNSFTEIPPEIAMLQSLEILSLRGNQLMSLPEELSKLSNLKKLYLGQNQLQLSLIPSVLKNKEKTNKVIVNALRNVFKW